jgi:hypothetical protein
MDKIKINTGRNSVEKKNSGTIKDINDSIGILEKLANIFISIFSIFKSNKQ